MPWDTEAYDTYTVMPDPLSFAGIYSLIGINSFIEALYFGLADASLASA
jgi:hypothetical protein